MSSKIKDVPSVSAKAGSNLNTVSMTQTRKKQQGEEAKIKGVPSVSVEAGSNQNTLSMSPTLELKKKINKEVPLQQSRTKIAARFNFHKNKMLQEMNLSCQKRAIWNKNVLQYANYSLCTDSAYKSR